MIIREPLNKDKFKNLVLNYPILIKVVVDIKRKIMAVGSEFHADEEQMLLKDGSEQSDLWGANYYPKERKIEYISIINLRPTDDNPKMEIIDLKIREKVKNILLEYFAL